MSKKGIEEICRENCPCGRVAVCEYDYDEKKRSIRFEGEAKKVESPKPKSDLPWEDDE